MDIQQDAYNKMQKINKITEPFPVILTICYFGQFWACRNHTQLKRHDNTVTSIDV